MTRVLLAGALLALFVLAWQGVASLDSSTTSRSRPRSRRSTRRAPTGRS